MTALHQIVPTLASRDAIGNHSLRLQRLLRSQGIESEIFTEFEPAGRLRDEVRSLDDLAAAIGPETTFLYQASTASKACERLRRSGLPLLMNYHNVTPAEYFQRWDPRVALELRVGRRQIAELAPDTEFAIADSSYNADELASFGFKETAVVPILLEIAAFDHEPDPEVLERVATRRAAGSTEWLFVGRVTPNKSQHDLIKALAYARTVVGENAHLTLIGGPSSLRYFNALQALAVELGLRDHVTFANSLPPAALSAYYRSADVFVCLSEHEGFCVPLVEAMYHGLPVVAFEAAAVGETLDGAGILLADKRPSVVAEAAHVVGQDASLRAAMIAAGSERAAAFDASRTEQQFLAALAPFVA